jgi:hypothetical protein
VNKAVGQAVSLPRVGSVVAVARVNHSLPQRKRRSRSNDSAVREPTPASRSAAELSWRVLLSASRSVRDFQIGHGADERFNSGHRNAGALESQLP